MRMRKLAPVLAIMLALALIAAACGDDDATTTAAPATTAAPETTAPETTAATADPVVACELAYFTGEFAAYGPFLTASLTLPINYIINEDPPLGRTWEYVGEDIGTVGEDQATRTCLEQHGADILISAAHGYRTYRSWILEWIAEHDSPLMPTIHGGTIPGNLGGNAAEPIFRAQGLDEALGMTGSLYAEQIGAETMVIFATEVEGFQIAATAAELAAAAVGIEVLERIDVQAELPSYRAESERIVNLDPDVVIVQAGSIESANLINGALEAGGSLNWIGETGWVIPEFMEALGVETIATQAGIGFAAFDPNRGTPAWEFWDPIWTNTPGYGDTHGGSDSMYHFSAYDVLTQTALAVEYAGSYAASAWAPAMFAVGDPPGTVCYNYHECLALIRAGEDIDYEGVTGSGTYSEGGVNDVRQSYTPYNEDGTLGDPVVMDAEYVLEIIDLIAVDAECDENNECTW